MKALALAQRLQALLPCQLAADVPAQRIAKVLEQGLRRFPADTTVIGPQALAELAKPVVGHGTTLPRGEARCLHLNARPAPAHREFQAPRAHAPRGHARLDALRPELNR